MSTVERMARGMARGLGDDFDSAFANKGEWNAARGEKGGRRTPAMNWSCPIMQILLRG